MIYHGDCRDVLPQLSQADLVLTDPPYGLGQRMQGGTWGSAVKYADLRNWDTAPSLELMLHIILLSKQSIIWGGNNFALPPSRSWLVWEKQNAVPTMSDCEFAWTNCEKPAKRFSWPVGVHRYGHPTEKPEELFAWCLRFAELPKTVLDPFMGSGTTLRAAKDIGASCVGIEIEEKYCEIAARRLQQEVLPL